MLPNIRYGKATMSVTQDGVTEISTVAIHDYTPQQQKVSYEERKQVSNDKEILAEFLKFMDTYRTGTIKEPVFRIVEKNNQPHFVVMEWSNK